MTSPAAKSAYLGWLAAAIAGTRGASSRAAEEDDLILGYATGYGPADVAPFVRSLRAVHAGPVVLVTDQTPDMLAFLAAHDIESAPSPAEAGWAPHAVLTRFAVFDRLLAERPWVRTALLTDVRDVVFQAPPLWPAPSTLEFFDEYDGAALGDHAFNMKHLRGVGGEEMAGALADRACVCVGTVVGPAAALRRFCRTLLALAAIPRSEVGGAFGADQAACNLAVHLGLVEGEVRSNYGRVATLGLTPRGKLNLKDGLIRNPDGGVSPIVHQYDRHGDLAEAMHARWGEGFQLRERRRAQPGAQRSRRLAQSLRRRVPELR